jgi:hypothetical protein
MTARKHPYPDGVEVDFGRAARAARRDARLTLECAAEALEMTPGTWARSSAERNARRSK